jgi:V8-like Glu-specific endopeptidase
METAMKRLFLTTAALALIAAVAHAEPNIGKIVYTSQADDDSDLDASERVNRLKAPDRSKVVPDTRPGRYRAGGRKGALPTRLSAGARRSALEPQEPPAFGSHGIPYTTTRVQDAGSGASGTTRDNYLSTTWPYGAIGKLTFSTPQGNSFCSASVIRRGLVVTAAHCYQDFGSGNGFFTNFKFRPGHYGAVGATTNQIQPYGTWKVLTVARPDTWANGTDTGSGSARNNDLAIFVIKKLDGDFIGDVVGYFGYSWNNLGFTSNSDTGNKLVAATSTLGYPALMDKGRIMQRADGPTYLTTVGGSLQMTQGNNFTGGASGGPWILNFSGVDAVLSGGAKLGDQPFMAITGVTSWGAADPNDPKDNFSSRFGQNPQFPNADYSGFGAGNIGALIEAACGRTAPEGGTFAANGYCD